MSNVRHLLESLGLDVKPEGSQLRVDCQACDDGKKHLYIRPDTVDQRQLFLPSGDN